MLADLAELLETLPLIAQYLRSYIAWVLQGWKERLK